MKDEILRSAVTQVGDDTKFVRLATATKFVHSLLFTLYLIYLVVTISSKAQGSKNIFIELLQEYTSIILSDTGLIIIFLVLIIIGVIGYFLLPPIWEASLIYYLDDPERRGTLSFAKGMYKFFPMFEYNALTSALNLLTFMVVASRMFVLDILRHWFSLTIMTMRLLIILAISFLLPYTRLLITLEDVDFFAAMRKSGWLSVRNFTTTIKFVVITFMLYIRFVVNILIVVGIPMLLIRVGTRLGLDKYTFLQIVFVGIIAGLIILVAYIEGIIEAFVMTYRYKVYKHVKSIV